ASPRRSRRRLKVDGGKCSPQQLRGGAGSGRLRRKERSPAARTRQAMEQPDHVAGNMRKPPAGSDMPFGIGFHGFDQAVKVESSARLTIKCFIHTSQNARRMIGSAAKHHGVDMLKMRSSRIKGLNAAIDADKAAGMLLLQAVDTIIVERRNLAVFLRAEPLQPRFSGVHP